MPCGESFAWKEYRFRPYQAAMFIRFLRPCFDQSLRLGWRWTVGRPSGRMCLRNPLLERKEYVAGTTLVLVMVQPGSTWFYLSYCVVCKSGHRGA